MSDRGELAETISKNLSTWIGIPSFGPAHRDYFIADAILAAGYRKPRTVTSVEELDALPVGSVVRLVHREVVFVLEKLLDGWCRPGTKTEYHPSRYWIGATVLYTPEPQP